MPAETKLVPYEFLARWDESGNLQGSHAIFMEQKVFEDEVLASQMGQALTPDQARDLGFPFEDVLSQLQADALAECARHEDTMGQMTRDHAAEIAAKDEAIQFATSKQAESDTMISALEAQIANLTAQVEGLTSESGSLKAENESLKTENESLKTENDSLRAENASLKTENDSLKADNAALQAERGTDV